MESTVASTRHRITAAIAGLAVSMVFTGCSGHSDNRQSVPSSPATRVTSADVTSTAAPTAPLTITSPAFGDGAPIPARFTCRGENVAPPLVWSAPSEAAELALVLDDPDAVGGLYVHWIVTGIDPGPGSTTAGQTPAHGRGLPNSGGRASYFGPCPPAGTGTHHYRFTLYQLPAALQLAPGSAGVQAAQSIARAAGAQARLTATFQG